MQVVIQHTFLLLQSGSAHKKGPQNTSVITDNKKKGQKKHNNNLKMYLGLAAAQMAINTVAYLEEAVC